MAQSKIDPERDFNTSKWLISFANLAENSPTLFSGHAGIIVEGYLNKHSACLMNAMNKNIPELSDIKQKPGLFVGEYDAHPSRYNQVQIVAAQLGARKPDLLHIKIQERANEYPQYRDVQYKKFRVNTYAVHIKDAFRMIVAIKQEKRIMLKQTQESKTYQMTGLYSIFTRFKPGHNCVTWAIEKLKIAGVDESHIKDSSVAKPFWHVGGDSCRIL